MNSITKILILVAISLTSCVSNIRQGKSMPSFKKANYIAKAFWQGGESLTDSYLNFKEYHYFEYYTKIFGLRNSYHNGLYQLKDSLILFCEEKYSTLKRFLLLVL
jgi:hypothetical protein